jgi:hypothetical protein
MTVFNAGLPQFSSSAGDPIGTMRFFPSTGTFVQIGDQVWLRGNSAVSASGYPDAAKVESLRIAPTTAHASTYGNQVRQVATDGNGTFVVVASGGVRTSTDGGATWTSPTVNIAGSGTACAVAYGGGRFVVAGNDATNYGTAWSTNGTTWTSGAFINPGLSLLTNTARLVFGNSQFVGVVGTGNSTIVNFTSANGSALTAGTNLGVGLANTSPQLAFNGSAYLIACRAGVTSYTSTNGTSWTSTTQTFLEAEAPYVAGANGVFLAITSTNAFVRSTDNGATWASATNNELIASALGIWGGGNQFLVASPNSNRQIALSSDGVIWGTRRFTLPFDTTSQLSAIGFDGTRLIAYSDTAGFYSTNVNQASFVGTVYALDAAVGVAAYVRIK